ncbi:class I adenylate-forming enzyme family protein [Kaarinaea lacus]
MLTLSSVLTRTVRMCGECTAITDAQTRLSWNEFGQRVSKAATVLQSLGVRPSQRFGIISHNSYRNAELMQAGYWMGAVPVPVNFRLAPPEIAFVLDNAECQLLVIEDEFLPWLQSPELSRWSEKALLVTPPPLPNSSSLPQYESLLNTATAAPAFESQEDDDAVIIYTGGTTGRPKGVRLSHRNIVTNALQLGWAVKPRTDDVYLHVAPMFHSAEFLANPFFLSGAAQAYLPKFSASNTLQAIQDLSVTCTLLTPTMIIMLLQEPSFDRYDLSSLRQIIYGSAPMAAQWICKAMQRFSGVEFIQSYGLTETAPILTTLGMDQHQQAVESGDLQLLHSVGQPLPGVDLKIVDSNDNRLPYGKAGEVVVRAPNVAKGYLNRPDATTEAFRDGWFFTGDIGRLDEHGYLYLLDRKKDLIITGSELVFSLEVESVLYQHPKVHECAVVGVPDETYGEALLAAIVPNPGETVTEKELIEFCRDKIGGYKIPRRYVFLEHLPKSAMNKVLKVELRRKYGSR